MKYAFVFAVMVLHIAGGGNAQCPQVSLTIPDSACTGSAITIQNNTTGAAQHRWDFCPGDLDTLPVGSNLGNLGSMNVSRQIKVVEDNGNYYAFIANVNANNILRVDFGPSLQNPAPVTFTYSGFVQPMGIDVVKEGNNWIALVVSYGLQKLYRLDMGSDISANQNTITDLGSFGFFNPLNIKIVNDNGNYYAFVTNELGTFINKITFGNSLYNTPTGSSFSHPSFNFIWGFDMVYNCLTNQYIGFAASFASGEIFVIDFGNALSSTGTVVHTLNPSAGNLVTLKMVYDINGWNLMTVSASNNIVIQLKLGNNLLNPNPVTGYSGSTGGINSPRGIDMFKAGSAWYGIITNNNNTLSVLQFEKVCQASPPVFNNVNPSPVVYFKEGWQPVLYQAYNSSGFFASVFDSIFLSPRPVATLTTGPLCVNTSVQFTDQSTVSSGSITQWFWDFGDGSPISSLQHPQHTYTMAGSYLLQLIVNTQAGCSDTVNQLIVINDLPQSIFTFPNNQCRGQGVPFTDNSVAPPNQVINAWVWNFGDNSPVSTDQHPVHVFDSAGIFTVQLIVVTDQLCTDTSSQSITIIPGPAADFAITNTCVGDATVFTNLTTLQGPGTMTYQWWFGDGGTSTDVNPVYQYPPVAADYLVELVAESSNGCTDTIVKPLRISQKANASFTFSPAVACINSTIQFTSTSTANAGDSIIAISWNFGDSPQWFSGNPVNHQYTNAGNYTITLKVKTYSDCDTTYSNVITVLESPVADFSFQNVCLDSAVTFINQSSTPPGTTITTLLWNFGDGATGTGAVVSHQYLTAGTFTVTLTVVNNAGCSNTVQKQVVIHPRPQASFLHSFACSGVPVSFFNTSSISGGFIASSQWDFGDNTTSTQANPQHIFQTAGSYQVQLIVYSNFGCTDTTIEPLTVYQSPVFDFVYTPTCLGNPTQFSYINLNPGQPDTAAFWNWNFGDGTPASNLPSPSHLYAQSGLYQVTLVGTAFNTCSRSVTKQVSVNPVPQANFSTANFICLGTPSQFINQSTIASGTISQYIWNFGDGSPPSNAVNPTHIYNSVSSFQAQLIAVSDSGCTDTTTRQISVAPLPVISFVPIPDYGSPPLTVTIQNTTPGLNTYLWNFGDGTPLQTGANPTHTYTDTGTFVITVIVTNVSGCSDSLSQTVEVVNPFPDLAITGISATIQNDKLQLYARISNTGNVIAIQFELRAVTGNGLLIYEVWQGVNPLKPGETITVPMASRFPVRPGSDPEFYCIEIMTLNGVPDAISDNNRQCGSLRDEFSSVVVFPSPAGHQLTAAFNVPADGTVDVCLYDISGKKVNCLSAVPVTKGFNEIKLPVILLSSGVYAVSVLYGDNIRTARFVK
jgi:PKD repeat protein